jgi:hypothetical protein
MLFDLRGRGRRRTIQVIYAFLAVLMGGGLIFFGIGGATSGGLFDAITGSSGSGNANDVVQRRLESLEKRVEANPRDAAAWAQLTTARFQTASSGENYDQTTQQFTDKGLAQLREASSSWQRYLALEPDKPNPNVARQMVQAYGQTGLQEYDKATQAMEIVIDEGQSTPALYAQLAILAHGAGQDRKSTLSAQKAQQLAGKDQKAQIKQAIDQGKAAIDQAKSGGAGATTTTTG